MRSLHALLLLTGVIGLAPGCLHVDPQPLQPQRTAGELEGRRLTDPGLRELLAERLGARPEPWPLERWGLAELTIAGLYFQPELRIAQASAAVAGARVETAGERPNPVLSVLPQWVSNPMAGANPWLASVQLDWPIETAGKREHRRNAARARARAAELAVRTASWDVRARVYAAVVALRGAEERTAFLARVREIQAERVALLEARLAVGAIAEAILAPARVALVQATADQAVAERQRLEALAELAAALAMPPSALQGIGVDFALDVAPADLEALGSEAAQRAALLGRSDVLALLDEYAGAEADLRLELARQIPDLHLGPAYEFDQGANKWGLVLSLELPVMNQNQGAIGEAVARRAEVAARFEALQAQVIAEVAAASATLRGARGEEVDAEALLDEARRSRDLVEGALGLGAADRLALLSAELELARTDVVLSDARTRFQQAAVRLERAVEPPRPFLGPGGATS